MGSRTGIAVADEVLEAHNELKMGHSLRYLVFAMDSAFKEVHVEKRAPVGATWADLEEDLAVQHSSDCRYAEFALNYDLPDGQGSRSKLVFVLWAPSGAGVKAKMLYAATTEAMKRALVGVALSIHAGSRDSLALDGVMDSLIRRM